MISPSMSLAEFIEQQAANRARVTSEINRLKRAVIAPLRHHGIASVQVAFDGCGDSGAIEDIACRDASDTAVDLPEEFSVCVEEDGAEPVQTTLKQALEDLAYAALELHHPGWEINDGAGGALEIDVTAETFMLDCKLRYTAYDDHYTEL